jgi:mannan endo-1,4-beta-mannosidase
MGWSWSGNSADLVSLDITLSFDVNSLSAWGNALIHDTNGIANTSQICTCFN